MIETNGPVDSLKTEAVKALESSKIKATLQVLRSISKPQTIIENDNNSKGNSVVREKAIVFSQWTRMLDLVEVCLKDSSIGYRRLDGTMSVGARDKAVKDFNTLPEVCGECCRFFLILHLTRGGETGGSGGWIMGKMDIFL